MTYTITLKTHTTTNLSKKYEGKMEKCLKHNTYPEIEDIVAGKEKEHHFVARCVQDECGKISMESADRVVEYWNKANENNRTN